MSQTERFPSEDPEQDDISREAARERTDTPEDRERRQQAADVLTALVRATGKPAYDLSDDGNVLRFRAVWGDAVRWCPTQRGGGAYWLFDGCRWIEDRTNEIGARAWAVLRAMEDEREVLRSLGVTPKAAAAVDRWVARSRSVSGHRRMIEGLRGQLGADIRDFDGEETDAWLNTPNALVSLRDGIASRLATPGDLITRVTGAWYVPGARCPRFIEAIDAWTCHRPELARYLQMVLGASLLPGTVTRQLVVWIGASSANGKSTLGEIMRRVLGDYAGTLSADALMQQRNRATHDELLAPLVGRRWVYASEGNEGARWDTALVKLLTGADAVSLRRIYGRQELARPTWTVMLATNHVPSLGLVDPAMRDRLRLLPFDHHVPREERVVDLAERLVEAEGPGILLWLLEGLRMVLRDGLGEPPEMVRRLTDDYFEVADDIGRYLEERTLRTPEVARQSIVASILYADYRAWCEEEGVEPVSLMRFGIRLTEEGVAKGSDARNRVTRLGIGFRECLSDATEQVVA